MDTVVVADPHCRLLGLVLVGGPDRDEELLCLGANTADNATQWVAALQITIKVAHKWPQWLARPQS